MTRNGLTGLANIGNTCYLNSCMQVLSHTNEFTSIMLNKPRLNKINESILLLEWDKLQQQLWSTANGGVVVPQQFVKTMQRVAAIKKRDLFTGYAQNDVQEFLLFLIDCFHLALQREVDMIISGTEQNSTDKLAKVCYTMMQNMYKKEYSELLSIFYGIHVSALNSEDGAPLSLTAEPFSVLSLSIPQQHKSPTLFDCLDLYCLKEKLVGANAWYNSETKEKQNVERGILFWSLPHIFIIDLKRWTTAGRKNQVLVDIPLVNVNFERYVRGYNANTYVYDLYGVLNHSGNVLGGHYTAYVLPQGGKKQWYCFNDTLVTPVLADKIITPYAYCLFYRKRQQPQ